MTYRATAMLRPDPRHARAHPRRHVEQIVASIRAFGFTNPVLVDPEGVLIAGHGRLLAAKELGWAEIELAGMSEAQKRTLRLADNKIALTAVEGPEDEVIPPMPIKPRTRPGDISRLGEHVAGCGDSRDPAFLRAVVGEGAWISSKHDRCSCSRSAPRRVGGIIFCHPAPPKRT